MFSHYRIEATRRGTRIAKLLRGADLPLFEEVDSPYSGVSLHSVGPYLGKLKPAHARRLVAVYSRAGDVVWDPFCGSGSVLLEAQLQGRQALGGDVNPYACLLSRAKLHAPSSASACMARLSRAADKARGARIEAWEPIPESVSRFFHSQTLAETLALRDYFLAHRDYFLLGCLLGILHHQRPSCLSYPASHFAPYLRDKKFPRSDYPEAYEYRDPFTRLEEKATRALRYPPPSARPRFRVRQASALSRYLPPRSVDVVITSPPYMKNLDYARDNRLRLWFLGVADYRMIGQHELHSGRNFHEDMVRAITVVYRVLKRKGVCILVLGKAGSGHQERDVPSELLARLQEASVGLELEELQFTTARRRAATSGALGDPRPETALVLRKP